MIAFRGMGLSGVREFVDGGLFGGWGFQA